MSFSRLSSILNEYSGKLHMRMEESYPLRLACTFGIGGEADCFIVPQNEEALIHVIRACTENGIRYEVIGAGSNVLFSDSGFRGAVIRTVHLNKIKLYDGVLTAQCGALLPKLCGFAARNGLCGFEGLCGIPGSAGGALVTSAGAFGYNIYDHIIACRVFFPENCRVERIELSRSEFSYRHGPFSRLATDRRGIILSAEFLPPHGDKAETERKMKDYGLQREQKQPKNEKSAGSYFMRPNSTSSAARLIDLAGLKGACVGGACVSEKHAGFIINRGNASASDVLMLADTVKRRVRECFGVELYEEVIYIE